jgi:hypothetical protein
MGDGAQPPRQQPDDLELAEALTESNDELELAEALYARNPTGFHPHVQRAWRWAEGVVLSRRMRDDAAQLWTRGGGRQGEKGEEDNVKMDKKKSLGKGMKEEGEAAEAPASQLAS